MSFSDKFKDILGKLFNKRSISILILLIFVGIWGLLRSCTQQEVKRKHLYLIGRDSTWYPLQLLGKEKNLRAFTNDLMSAISKEIGVRFEWVETSSANLLSHLNDENYDAIVSAMRPNFIRETRYAFSNPLFELGPVLIVNSNSPIKSLKDMQGLTIGIRAGSYFVFNNIKETGAHAYNSLLVTYDNMNKALELLERKQIDGIIMEALPAYAFVEGFYTGKLKIVTPPLTDEGLRIIALRNSANEELMNETNEALKKLKESGAYDQMILKWNLINPEIEYLKKNG